MSQRFCIQQNHLSNLNTNDYDHARNQGVMLPGVSPEKSNKEWASDTPRSAISVRTGDEH